MTISDILVKPFSDLILTDITIQQEINEHGKALIRGIIPDTLSLKYSSMSMTELDIMVMFKHMNVHIFSGMIESFKIREENNINYLELKCITKTFLLDLKKHTRSFQKIDYTYKSILSTISKNYDFIHNVFTFQDKNITSLILQYQETDWEFLKRMASHYNGCLQAGYDQQNIAFYFGVNFGLTPKTAEFHSLSTQEASYELLVKSSCEDLNFSREDSQSIVIESKEYYTLGTLLNIEDKNLYVHSVGTIVLDSELIYTYVLKTKNSFKVEKKDNNLMIGLSLRGTVTQVEKDNIQIALKKDQNGEETGARWFPYSSPYTSENGTGFYAMPEIGDGAMLMFSDSSEETAYTKSATHQTSRNDQERTNPAFKSLMNKQGKEILFKPDSITITNNAGMSIEILDNEGIKITSNKAINMKSDEEINLASATSAIQLIAPNTLTFQQGDTHMQLGDNVIVGGAQVHLD